MSSFASKLRPLWELVLGKRSSWPVTYFILLLLWVVLVLLVPQLALVLLVLNLFLMLAISGLQYYSALLPRPVLPTAPLPEEAFVSIHIPTHNEPPEVVISTLKALEQLRYPHFEVIVLDNNTADEQVWKPVEAYCQQLDQRFRFAHVDKLEGYKAGALNICHQMSDSRTDYILVIDADYQVAPALLEEALQYFVTDAVALVQFPQAYVNTAAGNRGMEGEYNHFFEVYMNMANHYNCVLSTGTVSVIRKAALEKAGLWSGTTITEDCELGLRLHQLGYRGVYVPKPLGKGLMPTDLKSLKVQRERWVFGNMQTLLKFLRLPKRKLCFTQCAGILTQLTAWFNFLLLPLLSTLCGTVAYAVFQKPAWYALGSLGIFSVWMYLLLKFIFFRIVFGHHPNPWKNSFSAYLTHLGMAWEGAVSWLRALCGENIRFKRTNKFVNLVGAARLLPNLLMALALLLAALASFLSGATGVGIACLGAAPAFLAVYYLRRSTQVTLQITRRLEKQTEVVHAA